MEPAVGDVVKEHRVAICLYREQFDVRPTRTFLPDGAQPVNAGILHEDLEKGGCAAFELAQQQTVCRLIDVTCLNAETIVAGNAHGDQPRRKFDEGDNFGINTVIQATGAWDSRHLVVRSEGAKGVLINITGGPDMTLFEVHEAASIIQEAADEEANIIFGTVIDPKMKDEVKVTVIATGFDSATKGFLNTRGEQLSSANTRAAASPGHAPFRPFAPKEIAAQHEVASDTAPPQVGAEGEIYDPPFFRKGLSRPDGSGGFGPMASSDFGNDLDIPTVIRNLSD